MAEAYCQPMQDARRAFKGRLYIFLLALACFMTGSPLLAAESPRRVFLLEGLTAAEESSQRTAEAIGRRLKERSSEDIEIYSDFLDLGRFQGRANEDQLVHFLGTRFAQVKPDIVIPISRNAVDFVVRHRGDFARGIPIVYCCANSLMGDAQNIPPDMPGVVTTYDWSGTIALAQRLQPNAKTLVVIQGAFDSGFDARRDLSKLGGSLQPLLQRYEIKYLTGLPYDELLRQVSRLPPNSIVLMRRVFEDGSGRARGPEVAVDVSKASRAPVYSPSATYIGLGIVGGRMDSFSEQGAKVADLALGILSGKDPSTLPHQIRLPLQYRVDARQLERWGFSESSLPPGTSVEFRQPTLWEQYRNLVLIALLAFAVQAGIIGLLLIQRRKRRIAEKLLKESEDRMALAAASTIMGIWRLDVASGQLWATEYCRSMFGIVSDVPLTWELFRAAVHPEDRHAFDEWLAAILIHQPRACEFRVILPEATTRWYGFRNFPVSNGIGEPLQVRGIFFDVTARKTAEAETELQRGELTHMLRVGIVSELSGAIAHELGQPLASILANAQAAQRLVAVNSPDKKEIGEILDDIVEQNTRAAEVIDRLRRFLRKGEHESGLVNLNDQLTSTLRLLHSELVRRGIEVQIDLDAHLPPVSGDRVQLQQVFLNLIMNAMDAMASTPPSARALSIDTRWTQNENVEVSITDRGPGMSPDQLKRVFEPYFTTKEHGLGLGLSICSTIVRTHQGQLNISNAVNGGVTAVVSLPAAIRLATAS